MIKIHGKVLSKGSCMGEALVSEEAVSFLGGVDPKTGNIIDTCSDMVGKCIKDKIFVFPCEKGSTVGGYVLLQLKKNGVAPKGIINEKGGINTITGAIIAEISLIESEEAYKSIKNGDVINLDATGQEGYVKILS
jgi:hypothetical protein